MTPIVFLSKWRPLLPDNKQNEFRSDFETVILATMRQVAGLSHPDRDDD